MLSWCQFDVLALSIVFSRGNYDTIQHVATVPLNPRTLPKCSSSLPFFATCDFSKTKTSYGKQVAVLRARLQSTEDEIDSVRREALLEGRARSVAEMAEAGKRDAAFRAEVEALKVRCEDQARPRASHRCTAVSTLGYEI